MSNLASWYREQGNYNKPLVLIISDLERCCRSVLSDFILVLSEWVTRVPVILIFGVLTTMDDAPRKILPSKVLQHLRPYKFILGSPAGKMDSITEVVLVKHCSIFSIGHKVALFLRNYLLNNDGTLTSFIRALKIACMLHIYLEPLSLILGQALAEEDQKDGILALSPTTILKYVHQLPYCLRKQMVDQSGKILAQGLSDLITVRRLWSTAILCLYEAGKCSRIRLLDLYCEILNPDFDCQVENENDSFQRGGFICQIVQTVRDLPSAILFRLIKSWEELTADVSEMHEKLKKSSKSSMDISKRHALNNRKGSRILNLQALKFIKCLIRSYMRPIECMPFHGIFCFNNVEKLQLALSGDPRRRVQLDLLEFNKILRCNKSCEASLPSMHDSSIMYSLAEKHGDLINLHDCFHSFKTIILHNRLKKKRKDTNASRDSSEASIQARFCKAVTELHIIGLLRMPTKRRPHCIQRIAFGL